MGDLGRLQEEPMRSWFCAVAVAFAACETKVTDDCSSLCTNIFEDCSGSCDSEDESCTVTCEDDRDLCIGTCDEDAG
jgi:hypothetical protein